MNEDSPNGCYGLRCKDCKLYNPRTDEEREECKRLWELALKKLIE